MTKETGGPAFPTSDWDENDRAYKMHGMTLRDYFAVKAMQALLSDLSWREDMNAQKTAYAAYDLADAMLKAREQ